MAYNPSSVQGSGSPHAAHCEEARQLSTSVISKGHRKICPDFTHVKNAAGERAKAWVNI